MAGTYEPEEESSIDLVPEEKNTVNTNATVFKMANQLLNLFSRPATTNTQPKADTQSKRKEKVSDFWDRQLLYSTTLQLMVKDSSICSYEVPKYKDRKRRKKEDWKMRIAFVGGWVTSTALVVNQTR